ncbi:hypothetical protein [Nocardia cyriacigeorgica]|uniref:hypothetical protein n=1 Tax=Nocardia cyriacigeorgica TaxID=135487 RepID=UPI00249082F2|nr:hypothetical protein [Nocardia cyriacigeorgica]BDT89850.1 hypothetical protein FMUAM8_56140 [Nocardia cyriacigeorgica]
MAIEFPDHRSVVALLRACVSFKFDCSDASELYVGSPQYAAAVRSVFDAVVARYRAAGQCGAAEQWIATFDLANHPERAEFVREYALSHPKWNSMDFQQRKDWVEVVAAPYRVSHEDYEWFSVGGE